MTEKDTLTKIDQLELQYIGLVETFHHLVDEEFGSQQLLTPRPKAFRQFLDELTNLDQQARIILNQGKTDVQYGSPYYMYRKRIDKFEYGRNRLHGGDYTVSLERIQDNYRQFLDENPTKRDHLLRKRSGWQSDFHHRRKIQSRKGPSSDGFQAAFKNFELDQK